MITPRRTRLISVPDLRALPRSVAGSCDAWNVEAARHTAVLVPTRSAAAQLRRTLERLWLLDQPAAAGPRAVVMPEIVTRGEWYRSMLQRSGAPFPLLSDIEREVLLAAAAREAIAAGHAPPFRMRPGLVAEMLAFYDSLKRQQKSNADFDRLVTEDLEPRAEFDRGAERLMRQTRFLVSTFEAFEAKLEAADGLDEHGARRHLLNCDTPPFGRVIVTIGDRASDPAAGLFPADFDLLARLPHLAAIDIVATRRAVLAGLGERIRELLPGIEEVEAEGPGEPPTLLRPSAEDGTSFFSSRDREEELRDVARRIKRDLRDAAPGSTPAVAVVFRRPLPYVYLGRTVFEAAGMEWEAADALPLAAEPVAAALDLVFSAVASRFARGPLMQLLRSPQFAFWSSGGPALPEPHGGERRVPAPESPGPGLTGNALAALDAALAESGYLGDVERLASFAEQATGEVARAARVAVAIAGRLAPLGTAAPLSAHLDTLLAFLRDHERLRPDHALASERHLRARAAVLRILEDMRAAALRYDDAETTVEALAPAIRRWLESQTFTPAHGVAGVQLVDASSARYGDFDDVHLVGVVAGDWPQSSGRNIFYPPFLLARLGWPPEAARMAAERAAFEDLLHLARRRVSVSCFTLEDDSIVDASPLLEVLERAGLPVASVEAAASRIFTDEALMGPVVASEALSPTAAAWAALRASRSPATQPEFHGMAGRDARRAAASGRGARDARPGAPRDQAGTHTRATAVTYTVTGIDRYLECPFKYFARSVLGLPEEVADEQGMSPKERGRFVHEVFRAFFAAWHAGGGRAITAEELAEARVMFATVVEEKLRALSPADAGLERMRLRGSVAAPGLGEIVLAAEAVRPTPVVERLLEFPFEGEFVLRADGTERRVRLRGKADRVDILSDGRLRLIDYKIGRAPDKSIQLQVYALCLTEQLSREGRASAIGEAFYVAFGERAQPIECVLEDGPKAAAVLEQAQARVLSAIDGIERGEFPPRPAAPRLCGFCAFAAVCRKDVVLAD